MNKVDISKWGEFNLKKLFDVSRPIARSEKRYNEGDVPFVSSGRFNNGITNYCEPKENEVLDTGNCITVSPVDGYAFYQGSDFLGRGGAGSSIMILRNENLTRNIALFIATVIRAECTYEYNDMGQSDINNDNKMIHLPAKQEGGELIPDWQYMENYITNLEATVSDSLDKLQSAKNVKDNRLSITSWKEFALKDIFKDFIKPMVLHSREVKESDGGIPYVVRTKFNNGIKCRVAKESKMKPSPRGVISWGAENASFFYQDEEWVSGRDIYYIDTRERTRNECLFIISCLRQIGRKYPYNYGLFPNLLKEEMISLPVKDNGEINWEYMNDYIENINSISEQKLEALSL